MRPPKKPKMLVSLKAMLLVGLLVRASRAQLSVAQQQPPYVKEPSDEFNTDETSINNNQNNRDFSLLSPLATNQTSSPGPNLETMPNFYSSSQASKFRVNVSNACERNQMRVTIRLNKPFYGLIHAKERRKKPACFVEGNGEQSYVLDISYTLVHTEPGYCGMVSHHLSSSSGSPQATSIQKSPAPEVKQTTLSVVLVVRLHKTIEFSDDRYFLLSCANRCAKPDCSQEGNQKAAKEPAGSQRSAFAASESILSPVLRSTTGAAESSKLAESGHNWATEKCDIMLDMKFQWLLKLCWVLSFLLVLMFFLAFYLCATLNAGGGSKSSRPAANKPIGNERRQKKNSYVQSENLSWSTLTTASGSVGQTSAAVAASEELSKIREDNSFLAQQNQQLMLANLLANTNFKNNTTARQIGYANNEPTLNGRKNQALGQHCLLAAGRADDFVLGRSIECPTQLSDSNGVKRRRSIGSSVAPILVYESAGNTRYKSPSVRHRPPGPPSEAPTPFDANHRAKSRSQTTIHYEQRQDPFKAVPFSYLNTGYLSDGATSQQVHLAAPINNMDPSYHLYQHNNQQRNLEESLCHSLPPESAQFQNIQLKQKESWSNYHAKPAFVPPPTQEKDINNNNRQVSSQFDPEQNSHQLIDLIQQKHRQQIVQASRTAATLAAIVPPEQMPPNRQHMANDNNRRAWR